MENIYNINLDQTGTILLLNNILAHTKVVFSTQAQIISNYENRKFEEVIKSMKKEVNDIYKELNEKLLKEIKESEEKDKDSSNK